MLHNIRGGYSFSIITSASVKQDHFIPRGHLCVLKLNDASPLDEDVQMKLWPSNLILWFNLTPPCVPSRIEQWREIIELMMNVIVLHPHGMNCFRWYNRANMNAVHHSYTGSLCKETTGIKSCGLTNSGRALAGISKQSENAFLFFILRYSIW